MFSHSFNFRPKWLTVQVRHDGLGRVSSGFCVQSHNFKRSFWVTTRMKSDRAFQFFLNYSSCLNGFILKSFFLSGNKKKIVLAIIIIKILSISFFSLLLSLKFLMTVNSKITQNHKFLHATNLFIWEIKFLIKCFTVA